MSIVYELCQTLLVIAGVLTPILTPVLRSTKSPIPRVSTSVPTTWVPPKLCKYLTWFCRV